METSTRDPKWPLKASPGPGPGIPILNVRGRAVDQRAVTSCQRRKTAMLSAYSLRRSLSREPVGATLHLSVPCHGHREAFGSEYGAQRGSSAQPHFSLQSIQEALSNRRGRVESQDEKPLKCPRRKDDPLNGPNISQGRSSHLEGREDKVIVCPTHTKRCPNHQKIGRLALIPLVAERPSSKRIARLRGKQSPANNAQIRAQSPKLLRLQRGCPGEAPQA